MDDTRKVPLTRGQVAIVDASDYEAVSQYRWVFQIGRDRHIGYARRFWQERDPVTGVVTRRSQYLHVFLMQPPPGMQVDHIDSDGLNCRRSNMRVCTDSQNKANRNGYSPTRPYKGVEPTKNGKRWRACISIDNRNHHLGTFDDPRDAARAYDAAARERFGEFARVNFPDA